MIFLIKISKDLWRSSKIVWALPRRLPLLGEKVPIGTSTWNGLSFRRDSRSSGDKHSHRSLSKNPWCLGMNIEIFSKHKRPKHPWTVTHTFVCDSTAWESHNSQWSPRNHPEGSSLPNRTAGATTLGRTRCWWIGLKEQQLFSNLF